MSAERLSPRISLNKLGEYIAATPARRRRIIYDQKFPQPFITARYADAQLLIAEYLSQPKRNPSFIAKAIDRLMSITPRSEWEEQNNALCAEALDHFVEVEDELDFGDTIYTPLDPMATASCAISNVEVSIRPELQLAISRGKRDGQIGTIKLAFSKTHPLAEEVGEHIASLLHHYATITNPKGAVVARDRCLLIDVFGEKVIAAPPSFKRRMRDVEAACAEIDAMWLRIK